LTESYEEFLKNYKLELNTTINSIKCLFNGVLSIVDILTIQGIAPPYTKEEMLKFWKEKTGIKVNLEYERKKI